MISFLSSLISFRPRHSRHLKIFSAFLGITALTELIANFFLSTFHLKSNYPVYNMFLLIQYISLGYYFSMLVKQPPFKKAIIISIFLYPVFWAITSLVLYNLYHWNSYAVMVGDLFMIVWASRYIFELFTSEELLSLKRHSEFWIAIGILFFSCCELPITGILNYIVKDWMLANKLSIVLQIINIIMYLIFIYAYLCRIKLTEMKSLS